MLHHHSVVLAGICLVHQYLSNVAYVEGTRYSAGNLLPSPQHWSPVCTRCSPLDAHGVISGRRTKNLPQTAPGSGRARVTVMVRRVTGLRRRGRRPDIFDSSESLFRVEAVCPTTGPRPCMYDLNRCHLHAGQQNTLKDDLSIGALPSHK